RRGRRRAVGCARPLGRPRDRGSVPPDARRPPPARIAAREPRGRGRHRRAVARSPPALRLSRQYVVGRMVDLRALLEMRRAVRLSSSPDGERLLVAPNVPGTDQLFVVPVGGGELRQLTDLAEPVTGEFLPDGRVLVEVDEGGNERTQLYVLADGGLEPLVV